MMTELNGDIKRTAQYYGITQRQIANELGISTATLTRILAKPLTAMKKAELLNVIDNISMRTHG